MAASLESMLAIKHHIRDIIVKDGGNIIKEEVNIIEEANINLILKWRRGVRWRSMLLN